MARTIFNDRAAEPRRAFPRGRGEAPCGAARAHPGEECDPARSSRPQTLRRRIKRSPRHRGEHCGMPRGGSSLVQRRTVHPCAGHPAVHRLAERTRRSRDCSERSAMRSANPPDHDATVRDPAPRFPVSPLPLAIGLVMAAGRFMASPRGSSARVGESARILGATLLMASAYFVIGYVVTRYLVAFRQVSTKRGERSVEVQAPNGYVTDLPLPTLPYREDRIGRDPRQSVPVLESGSTRLCLLGIGAWVVAASLMTGFAPAFWVLVPAGTAGLLALVGWTSLRRSRETPRRPRRRPHARRPRLPVRRAVLHDEPDALVR